MILWLLIAAAGGCDILNHTDIEGTDYLQKPVASADECCELCSVDPVCDAAVFNDFAGTCRLKSCDADCNTFASAGVTTIWKQACHVLTEFFDFFGGEQWINTTGWESNASCCNGRAGVACKNGYIYELILVKYNATNVNDFGSFPWNATEFINLRKIDMSENSLNGTLDFVAPRNLHVLYLMDNDFTGQFNVVGETILDLQLSYNNFTAPLVAGIPEKLPSLKYFVLEQTNISGTMASLGRLKHLEILYLTGNRFHGHIPAFGPNLTVLHSGDNQLHTVSNSTLRHPQLRLLNLANNQLNIDWTSCQGDFLPEVSILTLSGNSNLTKLPLRSILQCLKSNKALTQLSLKDCQLNGDLLDENSIPPFLALLELSGNKLKHFDPEVLSQTQLMDIDLSDNPDLREVKPISQIGSFSRLVVSNTAITVCFSTAFYRTKSPVELNAVNMTVHDSCAVPLNYDTFFENGVKPSSFNFQSESGLHCPVWQLPEGGTMHLDANVTDFAFCRCGNPNAYFCPRRKQCYTCPENVTCDNYAKNPNITDGNRTFLPPNHTINGERYPMNQEGELAESPIEPNITLIPCRLRGVCNNDLSKYQYSCAEGYDRTSRLCSRCSNDYFSLGESCHPCSQYRTVMLGLTLVCGIVGVSLGLYYASNSSARGQTSAAWSIWLFSLQSISTLSLRQSTNNTPTSFLHDVMSFRPWQMECIYKDQEFFLVPFSVMMLWFTVPTAVAGALLGLKHYCKRLSPPWANCDCFFRKAFVVIGRGLNLLFTPVLNRLLQVTACSAAGDPPILYLTNFPYADCWLNDEPTGEHLAIIVLLSLVLLVSTALLFYAVCSLDPAVRILNAGLASKGKKSKREYWSLVIFLRRILISISVMVFDFSVTPVPAFAVITTFWALQVLVHPYTRPSDNYYEALSLTLTLVLYFGIVMSDGRPSSVLQLFYTGSIVIVTAVFVVLVSWENRKKLGKGLHNCGSSLGNKYVVIRQVGAFLNDDGENTTSIDRDEERPDVTWTAPMPSEVGMSHSIRSEGDYASSVSQHNSVASGFPHSLTFQSNSVVARQPLLLNQH